MHKTKIGPESHSLKKSYTKRTSKIIQNRKMGNFSTRILKNAAETKSISQNSNKIIQKKLFSVCTFKKSLTTHRQIVLP